jgi:hypothetical protein
VDQGDPASLQGFIEQIGPVSFDIVIDDGSHRPDHQQISLGCLFEHVSPRLWGPNRRLFRR